MNIKKSPHKSKQITLRQALLTADLDEVYRLINVKDNGFEPVGKGPSLEQTREAYIGVVKELLNKPKVRAAKMPWLIQESTDPFDGRTYPDVCFLNRAYVAPKAGLKPWGCTNGKKAPKGHYDCNAHKHQRTYAAGFTPWSKVIDTPIIIEADYDLEKVVCEILWEITFYGWTEELNNKNIDKLKKRLDEATKEIEEGKFVELPPKKDGGFKVIIPDSVSQDIINISNKKK
jgi:hypothetical protein